MHKSKKEVRENAKRLARDLRRRMTRSERIFWEAVKNRRFMGKRFLRQHPIFNESAGSFWFYIVDFYCPAERIVIELDGVSHDGREDDDKERSDVIEANKLRVVRFRNEDVEDDSGRVFLQLKKLMNG